MKKDVFYADVKIIVWLDVICIWQKNAIAI